MRESSQEESRTQEWYLSRVEYLTGFMMPERREAMERVLNERTRYMTICMENTFHPQNASALVRHCEAFGVQDIHTIEELCRFKPNVNIVKGSDKWVDFHRYRSTTEALSQLKQRGYRIVATTPHGDDLTPEQFDVTHSPFALIFGTEHDGISEEVIQSADAFIKIPMQGFVDSLNVSASAAILIYMLSQRLRNEVDRESWEIEPEQRLRVLFEWMRGSIRSADRILEQYVPQSGIGT